MFQLLILSRWHALSAGYTLTIHNMFTAVNNKRAILSFKKILVRPAPTGMARFTAMRERMEIANPAEHRWGRDDMFNTEAFYEHLGATQSLASGDQLLLFDQVRVSCEAHSMIAIFESRAAEDRAMTTLFAVSSSYAGCLPFLTRSGNVALKLNSEIEQDETATALALLDAAMNELDILDDH